MEEDGLDNDDPLDDLGDDFGDDDDLDLDADLDQDPSDPDLEDEEDDPPAGSGAGATRFQDSENPYLAALVEQLGEEAALLVVQANQFESQKNYQARSIGDGYLNAARRVAPAVFDKHGTLIEQVQEQLPPALRASARGAVISTVAGYLQQAEDTNDPEAALIAMAEDILSQRKPRSARQEPAHTPIPRIPSPSRTSGGSSRQAAQPYKTNQSLERNIAEMFDVDPEDARRYARSKQR